MGNYYVIKPRLLKVRDSIGDDKTIRNNRRYSDTIVLKTGATESLECRMRSYGDYTPLGLWASRDPYFIEKRVLRYLKEKGWETWTNKNEYFVMKKSEEKRFMREVSEYVEICLEGLNAADKIMNERLLKLNS